MRVPLLLGAIAICASLLAMAHAAAAGTYAAPPGCQRAMAHAERAAGNAYQVLARAAAADPHADERGLIASRSERTFQRDAAACRSWSLASIRPAPGSADPSYCYRALDAFDQYVVTLEQEIELLRTYGSRPPAGTIDLQTLRMLGRLGTGQLRAWLWTREQCGAAIGAAPAPAVATSIELSSGESTTIAARSSRQYVAVARDVNSTTLRIPVVWSVEPAAVGTIDDSGYFEAGALGECGRIIATAGDISAWIDVCVVEVATASY
jgi:hypothetical protein